jgi:hypothetical protein
LITGIAGIGTAVAFFPLLKRQNEGLALGYVAIRSFECITIMVGAFCLLGVLTLREGIPGVDADDNTRVAIASSLVAVRDWTFVFGPGFCAGFGNGLLLGLLMLRSGLVPRNMALFGVIGGPLSLVGCGFVLFGAWEQDAPPQFLFTLGEIIWEASLTIYLLVKGFKQNWITAEYDAETADRTAKARLASAASL